MRVSRMCMAWAPAWIGGCGRDFCARRLVEHTRLPGRLLLALHGSDEMLLARGRISAVRRIRTDDGTDIELWVIRARTPSGPRGTVLLLHGLWDSRAHMYRPARRLADRGFDVVLPDLRAHGRSGGRYTTFGTLERRDLRRVMDALADEGLIAGPRYVVGFSMGAGVAVQYAATDESCRGVLAMAPVADARRIMRRMLRVLAPLRDARKANETIDRAGRIAGFEIDDASAAEAAGRLACPIIVVHGRCDLTVPPCHGRAIYSAAAGPKELHLVPFTGHNSLMFGRAGWIAQQVERLADGRVKGLQHGSAEAQ